MIREVFALRRLRWKLTLSYTLVAAVTLLALELILAGALVTFLDSDFLPRIVAQNLRDEVSSRLEKPMRQDPPDTEAVRRRLDVFVRNSGVRGIDRPPPPPRASATTQPTGVPSSWSTTSAAYWSRSPKCGAFPK